MSTNNQSNGSSAAVAGIITTIWIWGVIALSAAQLVIWLSVGTTEFTDRLGSILVPMWVGVVALGIGFEAAESNQPASESRNETH